MPRLTVSKLLKGLQFAGHEHAAMHVLFWIFWFLPLYLTFQFAAQWEHEFIDALLIPYSLATSILIWLIASRHRGNRWTPIAYKYVTGLWLIVLTGVAGSKFYFGHF